MCRACLGQGHRSHREALLTCTEPAEEWLEVEGEDEGRQGVTLDDAFEDRDGVCGQSTLLIDDDACGYVCV